MTIILKVDSADWLILTIRNLQNTHTFENCAQSSMPSFDQDIPLGIKVKKNPH